MPYIKFLSFLSFAPTIPNYTSLAVVHESLNQEMSFQIQFLWLNMQTCSHSCIMILKTQVQISHMNWIVVH
jgi:hypothetical protein